MTTRFEDKGPTESVVLEFDFVDQASAVTGTPAVDVFVDASQALLEPAPNSIKSGAPVVNGTKVLQRVVGGVDTVVYFFRCTANSINGDTLVIDAEMLVKVRPVLQLLTPKYLTRQQFENRFGDDELADLESNGNSYGEAENQASSEVDGYLAVRYTLPLLSVPALVQGWVADITRYRLWDEGAPATVKERYEAAVRQLEQLAKGLINLPPDVSGVAPTAGFTYAAESWERVFTEDSLRGF